MSRSSPRSRRCIWNSSARSTRSPTPRRRSFSASSPAAPPCINRDNRAVRAPQAARQGGRRRAHRLVRRARQGRCAADQMRAASGLLDRAGATSSAPSSPTRSARRAAISCDNSLAVLAAAALVGADLALAALALAEFKPPSGRGARDRARSARRRRRSLIDESYNANPASMARRAGAARPDADRPARPAHRRARRHAGTRAARRARCIAASPSRSTANAIDLVFCCGPLMRALWQALPAEPPRRLCRGLGRARSAGAVRDPCRRRRHGQGLARLAHGAHRQGAATAIPRQRRRVAKRASAQG